MPSGHRDHPLRSLLGAAATGTSLVVLLIGAPASAAERVALVVGNSAYEALPDLVNPEHDARLIGDRLEAIGFDVTLLLDAPLPAMTAAVEAFSERARDADVALLYYAGHGVQIDGHNFLIPVDATISTSAEVAAEAAALQQVLDRIERAGAQSVVVVLDACRDNPLADLGGSDLVTEEGGLGAGMARVERPGMLIAYATAPGQVAYDGTGGNSPFSASLAFFLQEPGLEAGALFRRVRQRVAELTAGAQFPLVTDGLFEAVYLNPPQSGPTVDALGHVNALLAIEDPGDRLAALEGFLAEEPQSRFAPLVRTAVEALRADRAVARAEVTGDPANALADWQVVVQAEGTRAGPLAAAAWVAAYPDGRFAAEGRRYSPRRIRGPTPTLIRTPSGTWSRRPMRRRSMPRFAEPCPRIIRRSPAGPASSGCRRRRAARRPTGLGDILWSRRAERGRLRGSSRCSSEPAAWRSALGPERPSLPPAVRAAPSRDAVAAFSPTGESLIAPGHGGDARQRGLDRRSGPARLAAIPPGVWARRPFPPTTGAAEARNGGAAPSPTRDAADGHPGNRLPGALPAGAGEARGRGRR